MVICYGTAVMDVTCTVPSRPRPPCSASRGAESSFSGKWSQIWLEPRKEAEPSYLLLGLSCRVSSRTGLLFSRYQIEYIKCRANLGDTV